VGLILNAVEEKKWPLNAVGVLSPEVNLRSSHNTKTTSIHRSAIAREAAPRAGELKTGPKTQKLPVWAPQCPKNPHRVNGQSSDTCAGGQKEASAGSSAGQKDATAGSSAGQKDAAAGSRWLQIGASRQA
jgi:hypothetical protein